MPREGIGCSTADSKQRLDRMQVNDPEMFSNSEERGRMEETIQTDFPSRATSDERLGTSRRTGGVW